MSLCNLERLLNHSPLLIGSINLTSKSLRINLNLLTRPPHESWKKRKRMRLHLTAKKEEQNEPDAIVLSLKAAMYHSHVFLMRLNETMANSEMYMLMSPSNLICLVRFRTSAPRPVRNISRARSPCPKRSNHDVMLTTPVFRIAGSASSWRRAVTSSEVRRSSFERKRTEA